MCHNELFSLVTDCGVLYLVACIASLYFVSIYFAGVHCFVLFFIILFCRIFHWVVIFVSRAFVFKLILML